MDAFTLCVLTYAERPDLEDQLAEFGPLWPEFIFHGALSTQYNDLTHSTFARFNLYVLDADERVLAAAVSAPVVWDGRPADLPVGWDDAVRQVAADHKAGRTPTTLCAFGAMVRREHARTGLGGAAIRAMKAVAADSGFGALIAPVRPTLKSRYPLRPIEWYMPRSQIDDFQAGLLSRVAMRVNGRVVRKSGIMAVVVQGGVVRAGDPIFVSLPPPPHASLDRV